MSEPIQDPSALVHLSIDGQAISVPKGTTVYQAAKKLGIDIPIFCYHEKMPPFGACRMCLVDVEKMPKLQTSCTLEATEGMVVKTGSTKAVEGREGILEFLLVNHPLDCPICDKAGECPLQDQTLKHGPGESRFCEDKRQFKKRLPLGPVLMLDRERCISCARCTRFGDVVAGDHALEFIDRGHKTEVGTLDGGPAQSKFIGNTIMICPVGALTSQVYRFKARPWDNKQSQSTCTLCPVGCSMKLDSRDGQITRTRSCENLEVNDIWMCDKGWFGYEFVSHGDRLKEPLIRRNGNLEKASWDEAIECIASKIMRARPDGKLAALGGNTLTIEENYLFQKLARQGMGVAHVDHRIGMPLAKEEEALAPGMEISMNECSNLSYALILGCDLSEEFPLMWLRLKESINKGAPVVFIGHFAPEFSRYLSHSNVHAPGAELMALAHGLAQIKALAKKGRKGAVFVGRQYLASAHRAQILNELLKWRHEIPDLSVNVLEASGNSMGARLAGMLPTHGPLGQKLAYRGLDAMEVMNKAATSGWDYLHVAGADPAAKLPKALWKAARAKMGCLVVQELFLTKTAMEADVVLPALSFVEKEGSFLNIESRVQKLHPGKELPQGIYSDAQIFKMIASKLHLELNIGADFLDKLEVGRLPYKLPTAAKESPVLPGNPPINSQKLYASFAPALFDQGNRMKRNAHLEQLIKEPMARLHPKEAFKRGLEEGMQVKISAEKKGFQTGSVIAKIHLDERVAPNTIVIPVGFDALPAFELSEDLLNGLIIDVTKEEQYGL